MLICNEGFISHINQSLDDHGPNRPSISRLQARTQERIQGLLRIIQDINDYLPDDWRLTRSSNTFSILVVPEGRRRAFQLIGRSYRDEKTGEILHILATILTPQMVILDDLHELQSHVPAARMNNMTRAAHPEILLPNLYYFQERPDDSPSPLFARQYERVLEGQATTGTVTQYHRVHPLQKERGVDPIHFRWVKWTSDGHTAFVKGPDSRYHGKDFWIVEAMSPSTTRRHKERHHELIGVRLGATLPPEPYPIYEEEFKFVATGTYAGPTACKLFFEVVCAIKELGECRIEPAIGSPADLPPYVEQIDQYFDDDEKSIFDAGLLCRLRRSKDVLRLTVKLRQQTEAGRTGYLRREEEVTITAAQAEGMINRGKLPVSTPIELLETIIPQHGPLKPVLTVRNHRRLLSVVHPEGPRAELCCDMVWFEKDRLKSGAQVEVEIESKGYPRSELSQLAACLDLVPGIKRVAESKYQRGMSWLAEQGR